MYKYELFSDAKFERFETIRFYEGKQNGLGLAFFDEFKQVMSFICEYPTMFPIEIFDVRKATLRRFPYHIYYRLHDDVIQVIAVSHKKQRPHYWQKRL